MRTFTRSKLAGIALLVISPLVGFGGMIWGIKRSFGSMVTNESAGIGAVGVGLWIAIIFCAVALFGIILGIVLIVLGRSKTSRETVEGRDL